ncbi:MAG: alpha-1,2-fucosyltransferase [Fibromonadales bacterium]|nr:alpha-1,2-fucosyltransferase [Fibromonadales bacterium]
MITIKLMGGLGNQMFQYAYGFALAKRKKTKLLLDISFFSEKNFDTPRTFELDQLCITQKDIKQKPLLAKIPKIGNKLKPLLNYFEGYFQDEKYFADCEAEIRKEYQFKDKLQTPEGNTVAIHVRRGDYVKFADIHLVCTPSYYENAIAYVQSKVESPIFYVFSEDLEWVRQNINIPSNSVFVDYNPNMQSSRDMQFMSLCKHQIISNSTYSWWAAWLNQNPDKIVVAPDKWFADGRETDLYTENMVKISSVSSVH